MGPQFWEDHARRDRRNPMLIGKDGEIHSYGELLGMADAIVAPQLNLPAYAEKHERAQRGLGALGAALEAREPDAVVVIGDDQDELCASLAVLPAIGIYTGEAVWDLPDETTRRGFRVACDAPDGRVKRGSLRAPRRRCPAARIAQSLTDDEFDIMHLGCQPQGRSIGHAFNFVRYRLGLPAGVPIVPVLLSTYFGPNVLSPARCYWLGRASAE